jgi:hypothetical protein
VNRYLTGGGTACVIQRIARFGAALFDALETQAKLARLVLGENAPPRHQVAELFHRFPVFTSQIFLHTATMVQLRGQY